MKTRGLSSKRMTLTCSALLALAAMLAACADNASTTPPTEDAGRGSGGSDAAVVPIDAARPAIDAGSVATDAAGTAADVGIAETDAAPAAADTGVPDAAPPDAGPAELCSVRMVFGPTPYLSRADSPIEARPHSMFVLYDFEDRMVEHPGVQACGGGAVGSMCPVSATSADLVGTGGAYESVVDSVDGDDGTVDGHCMRTGETCHSVFAGNRLRFEFAPSVLDGELPRAAGLVYTDAGGGVLTFRAYDAAGMLVATIGPSSEAGVFPDSSVTGTVAEDRFFGACSPDGIAAIELQGTGSGLEIDHVQIAR